MNKRVSKTYTLVSGSEFLQQQGSIDGHAGGAL